MSLLLYACIAVAVFSIGLYYSVEETKEKENEEEQVFKEDLEKSESSNEE